MSDDTHKCRLGPGCEVRCKCGKYWSLGDGDTWAPRVIPNPIPVTLSIGDVWDALVDVVLDVCCWLFRKVVR